MTEFRGSRHTVTGPFDRIVRHDVRGLGEGDAFTDAQELADAYGDVVFSPSCWPDEALPRRFFRSIATAAPAPSGRHYWIVAEMPDGRPPAFLRGARRGGTQEAGIEGWEEVAALSQWRALGRSDGSTAQIVLQREGQHLHLVSFPSMEVVVQAAVSLERFDPARLG